MEIKKDSFVYKVAYGLNEERDKPDKTNFCRFFWRFVFYFFIGWPVFFLFVCLLSIIVSVCSFWFARRCSFLKSDSEKDITVPFGKWPTIRGRRIWPVWLLSAVPAWYAYKLYIIVDWLSVVSSVAAFLTSGVALLIEASAVGALLGTLLVIRIKKSDVWRITAEYVRARKNKVCPLIEFTN